MSTQSSVVPPGPEHSTSRRPARSRRRAAALAALLLVAACGGGDESGSAAPTTTAAPTLAPTVEPTATPAPAAATEPTPLADDDAATDPGLVNADPVLVDLDDFKITTATITYRAGTINFEVTNGDDIPHEFGIARGARYEDLPQLPNGSIDEDALGEDFLGKTAVVDAVLSPVREISYDLEPGQYVFFCNLVVGPVSHAARGQVLSVTVVEDG